MSRKTLNIAIAGCGPAGLAAALFLSRTGHRVTLFDQFEQPRPLGSGLILQPTGLSVLAELGLGSRIAGLGQRIDRLFGRTVPSDRIVLDVRYNALSDDMFGVAVHRSALFNVLFDAVKQDGIALETGKAVMGFERGADSQMRVLRHNAPASASFDLLVDALGVRSPFGSLFRSQKPRHELAYGALWGTLPWPAAGFDINTLEQRYRRASAMVGMLPIGSFHEGGPKLTAFFWSLKPGAYEAWRRSGLDAWKEEVMRLWPQLAPVLEDVTGADDLTLARYSHHTLSRPVAQAAVAIGDAAHAASPQLGQGANMALLDARALAVAIDAAPDLPSALRLYADMRRWHVRLYQALSFSLTPLYQSDSRVLPLLRDKFLAPASRWPGIRQIVASSVTGTLLDPRARLQLSPIFQEEILTNGSSSNESHTGQPFAGI